MPNLNGSPNATTDRVCVTVRWLEEPWDQLCGLAREWGVSRNDMANILLKEALEARALKKVDIDLTLDERGRERVAERERAAERQRTEWRERGRELVDAVSAAAVATATTVTQTQTRAEA